MPLDLSRVRALCFDVDGTISDTDDLYVARFERLFYPFRDLFPAQDVRPFARRIILGLETPGNWLYYLLDRFGLDDEVGWVYNRLARMQHSRPRKFLPTPFIADALAGLHERFPMCVVSSRDRASTIAFLEATRLSPHFHAVATSQTCAHTKPFPDPILWAAQQMGVEPHECLMIGDTTVDIRAGKAAGAQTVGVLCGFGMEAELVRAGADLILPLTADLLRVLIPEAVTD